MGKLPVLTVAGRQRAQADRLCALDHLGDRLEVGRPAFGHSLLPDPRLSGGVPLIAARLSAMRTGLAGRGPAYRPVYRRHEPHHRPTAGATFRPLFPDPANQNCFGFVNDLTRYWQKGYATRPEAGLSRASGPVQPAAHRR